MNYTLKLFNTGQITLPKKWRERYDTKLFLAEETESGLLIRPLETEEKSETVYYEDKDGFGLYCEKGLDVELILKEIKKVHGQD